MRTDALEAIAVVVVSSQKSAPVAVTVISYITNNVAAQGLLAIPAIVGQLTQIFMGSAIAALVAKHVSEAAGHFRRQQLPFSVRSAAALTGSHSSNPINACLL